MRHPAGQAPGDGREEQPMATSGGSTAGTAPGGGMQPFQIAVPEADLADLRARLSRARWPAEPRGSADSYGVPLGRFKQLAAYWARCRGIFSTPDWREIQTFSARAVIHAHAPG
jgi:hypothetical protein